MLPLPHLAAVFDHDMSYGDPRQLTSVLNLNNYQLLAAGLGNDSAQVRHVPGRHAYDIPAVPPTLQPGHYELQIGNIASTDGLTLPATYVTTFDAVSDFSALVDIEFSLTRADRGEQSVSYDVVVTNVSDRDLLLPLVLMLDPAEGYTGVPRNAAGQTPGGQWLVDLSQSLSPGEVLVPGASTRGHTLTIDNPGGHSVDFVAGFSAQQGANQAPVFDSQPMTHATADQDLRLSSAGTRSGWRSRVYLAVRRTGRHDRGPADGSRGMAADAAKSGAQRGAVGRL